MIARIIITFTTLLILNGCIEQSDAGIDRGLIFREAQRINAAHNQGYLGMDQIREAYSSFAPYASVADSTQGAEALAAFYAGNLSRLDQNFINLEGDKAFLIVHSTVKAGEAFMEKTAEQRSQISLASLKKGQQRLLSRHQSDIQ